MCHIGKIYVAVYWREHKNVPHQHWSYLCKLCSDYLLKCITEDDCQEDYLFFFLEDEK